MLLPKEYVVSPCMQSMAGRFGTGKIANFQPDKASIRLGLGSRRAGVCGLPDSGAGPKGQEKLTSGRGGFGESLLAKLLKQKCMPEM